MLAETLLRPALERFVHHPATPTKQQPSATENGFSPQFQENRQRQSVLETGLIQVGLHRRPGEYLNSGQDHEVRVVQTDGGRHVVKELKPTSRAYLVFGLGVPAEEVPPRY